MKINIVIAISATKIWLYITRYFFSADIKILPFFTLIITAIRIIAATTSQRYLFCVDYCTMDKNNNRNIDIKSSINVRINTITIIALL